VSKNYYGYAGKILEVNLTDLSFGIKPLPEDLIKNYLGGKGFGAKILYERLSAETEPLSAENLVVIATGPFTGTLTPTEKTAICTKSPLTGIWLDTNSGGYFGPQLKAAGFDMVVIAGKADKPVSLIIENDEISFEDATSLWGKDTFSTSEELKKEHGEEARVACIGPAGENEVPIAAVISEARAFGRGGSGAVLGHKNLKAVVAKGDCDLNIYNKEEYIRANREAYNEIDINPDTGGGRPKYGTNVLYSIINEAGVHPVKNFSKSVFEERDQINEHVFAEDFWVKDKACHSCPIKCSKIARVKKGKYEGKMTEGPEYENTWSFGAQCGVANPGAIIYGEYLCDYYGMDSISAGNIVGFAMECSEKGLIEEEIKFGDHEKMIELIKGMGTAESKLGRLLGQGVREASQVIGGDSDKFAIHTKGLEFPAYEPRASFGMGLAYATSDRGACHLRAIPVKDEVLVPDKRIDPVDTEYKAELVINQQNLFSIVNSLGICLFATFALAPRQLVNLLYSLTGEENFSSTTKLLTIGERIYNLTRLFNNREGIDRKDDTLPYRQLEEPLPDGRAKGYTIELESMIEEYYHLRGWDENGIPKKEKLQELDLIDVYNKGGEDLLSM